MQDNTLQKMCSDALSHQYLIPQKFCFYKQIIDLNVLNILHERECAFSIELATYRWRPRTLAGDSRSIHWENADLITDSSANLSLSGEETKNNHRRQIRRVGWTGQELAPEII